MCRKKYFYLLILICLLLIGILILPTKSSSNLMTEEVTPIPTATPYLEKAGDWRIYNNAEENGQKVFSFELPFVGPLCNGCFNNIAECSYIQEGERKYDCSVETISGGTFSAPYKINWLFTKGVFKKNGSLLKLMEGDIPPTEFVSQLFNLNIGEKIQYHDPQTDKDYQFELKNVRYIKSVPFLILSTDLKSDPEMKETSIALFETDENIYYLAVEYRIDAYKNVFQHMLDSFSFTLREKNNYGITLEEYNKNYRAK